MDKFIPMAAPVAAYFRLMPSVRRDRKVVCVGRWSDCSEDQVKRPEYMMRTVRLLVERDPWVVVEIYGRLGETVQKMYDSLPEICRSRVHMKGSADNKDLPSIYNSAQVSICTSRSESTHIASAEALCCGCSVVVPPRDSLLVLQWYASSNSGSIAKDDTPESLADSVLFELNLWEKKIRKSEEISANWQQFFHVEQILHRVFDK